MIRSALALSVLAIGSAHADPAGHKPTTDIEEIAWKHGLKAVEKELDMMKKRCGFTIPVDVIYDVPMKVWTGAVDWGLNRQCADNAKSGGCVNLSWCGSEIVTQFWFSACGYEGEGVKTAYKDWNKKIKRVVCRGDAPPAGTSAQDHKRSKMKAELGKDGTLTVTLHPSDSNISTDFWEWLSPRIQAD
jgi:hypothetical protein